MKKVTMPVPLYFALITIIQAKGLGKVIKKHKLGPEFEDSESLSIRARKKGHYVLAFKPSPTPGEIAHEASHIAHMIFEDRHVKADPDNDEPYAYLLEWIVDQVHKNIKIKS